jgi:hypothetical protein
MNFAFVKILLIGVICIQMNGASSQLKPMKEINLDPLFQKGDIQNIKYYGDRKIINTFLGLSEDENLNMDICASKIYLNVNGTGILYSIDSNKNYSKIDSTKYQGNYFGSAFFTYGNKIYNAGGYGFWDLTGSIRYFDTLTSEWGYLPTNKNIPFSNGKNSITFVDKQAGLLYLLYVDYEPEYVSQRSNPNYIKLQCYNLSTQKWWDKYYKIDKSNIKSLADIHFIHFTKNGVLINLKDYKNTYELNFAEKSFYKIDYVFVTQLFQIKESLKNFISYNIKDTLYFYDCENNILKSLVFNDKLKKRENSIIFKQEDRIESINGKAYIILIVVLLLFIIVLSIGFLFLKKRNLRNDLTEDVFLDDKRSFRGTLENQEIDILTTIFKNTEQDKMTSVEELNNILGLKNKSYKIQNNIRAEVINTINKKFKILTNLNDLLIERKRTEFDKRYFEYFINKKYISKISKYI